MFQTPNTRHPTPNTQHQTPNTQHLTPNSIRKIKVAQVITRMDWGGSPDILRITCDHLNPEVYDLDLVIGLTKYPSGKTGEFLKRFKGKITIIPQLKREVNLFWDIRAFLKLYLLLRKGKFDIVHTHTAKAGALGRIAARLAGVKVIVHTPHGHNFYGYFGAAANKAIIFIERLAACFTDKIIVFTELEKKDFIKFKVAPKNKVVLIYQGLELDKYSKAAMDKNKMRESFNIGQKEFVVGFIGRLEPVKGLDYFVDAASRVEKKNPNVRFILVGDGSMRQGLENKVRDLGIAQRFIFTGWREDIAQINSMLDILVLPSLNEAVGISLIEAQSAGVPVIATNVGGIPEVVNDNITGLLVPAADAASLAGAIEYLLENDQKRIEMSEAAKAWVAGKFKAEDMADKISRLYNELVNLHIKNSTTGN